MSKRRAVRPGPRSLVALKWLARVGASPGEPLALAMGWSEAVLYDHVARLAHAGFVRRVPMTFGTGSLIVITRDGAAMAGLERHTAPRDVAPPTWAHTIACAWAAARYEVRGSTWLSSREILEQEGWQGRITFTDANGRTHRHGHNPDLAIYLRDGMPAAVEVELQRKSMTRLVAIMRMYEQRCDPRDGDLAGILYITASDNIARPLRDAAARVGLREYPDGPMRLITLDQAISETRQAAGAARTLGLRR